MNIGATIDELYALRSMRLELEDRAEVIRKEERELRNTILEALDEAHLSKASGNLATCGIKNTVDPMVVDWDKVFLYVKETDRFDLLHKRISVLAWRELLESGAQVPGTDVIHNRDISLTKSSRS